MSKIPEIRADKGDVIGIGIDGSGNIIGKDISVVINEVHDYGLNLLVPIISMNTRAQRRT